MDKLEALLDLIQLLKGRIEHQEWNITLMLVLLIAFMVMVIFNIVKIFNFTIDSFGNINNFISSIIANISRIIDQIDLIVDDFKELVDGFKELKAAVEANVAEIGGLRDENELLRRRVEDLEAGQPILEDD